MSIMEVVLAMFVLVLIFGSILDLLLYTNRITAETTTDSSASTIAVGYMEQLRSIPLTAFINADETDSNIYKSPRLTVSFTMPTIQKQNATTVQLRTTPSDVTSAVLLGSPPGTTPTGAVDNLQSFDVNDTLSTTTGSWTTIWPGATSYTSASPNPGASDLHMNFWLQVTDLTPAAAPKNKAYGILLIYTWQVHVGSRTVYRMASLRSIRSSIPLT